MQRRLMLTAVAAAALLAACGGGDDDDWRGSLVEDPTTVATLTAAQITAGATQSGLVAITGQAKCDVRVVAMNYRTPGAKSGEQTNASGVVLVPAGACATQAAPLVAYAKGTDVQKPRTLANPTDAETFLLAAMYAAQGYAVVATDYLGYAKSAYSFHPYLHADSEASSVIDSIRAARKVASAQNAPLSGKVMVTGYSQGGHSSMAAHREIERNNAGEINLVAGAHLAGPYNLSGSFKVPTVIAGYQFFVPFIISSYQKVYGNVYTDPNTVYNQPYASYIADLLPSPTLTYTTLVTTGRLPGGPGVTPEQARDVVFKTAYVNDVQTNPNNALFQNAQKNDLLDWAPKGRTLLCSGSQDPTVLAAVHQAVAKQAFDAKGVTTVTVADVDPMIRATFGINGQPPTDPRSAEFANYYGSYHGTYAPPFCHAAARTLFDAVK